jgi:ribosomal-protein-alanine N-acetyltransferase
MVDDRGPAQFALRDYRVSDFDALVALDRECFEPGIAYRPHEMRRFLGLASREAVVAQSGDEIAGFCIGHRTPPSVARIVTLDVSYLHRRMGVGRALLRETMSRLSLAGARETILEVDVRNAGAIAFYERLGFERTGRIPDYYGPGRPAYEMAQPSGSGGRPGAR